DAAGDRKPALARVRQDVVDDDEVVGIAELPDDAELPLDPFERRIRRIAPRKPRPAERAEPLHPALVLRKDLRRGQELPVARLDDPLVLRRRVDVAAEIRL